MSTEAQKAAMRRYYEKNKGKYKCVLLRLHKERDKDIVEAFEKADSNVALVRDLIRGKKWK